MDKRASSERRGLASSATARTGTSDVPAPGKAGIIQGAAPSSTAAVAAAFGRKAKAATTARGVGGTYGEPPVGAQPVVVCEADCQSHYGRTSQRRAKEVQKLIFEEPIEIGNHPILRINTRIVWPRRGLPWRGQLFLN